MKYWQVFGGKATQNLVKEYEQSPHWKNGSFQNLETTDMSLSFGDVIKILSKQFQSRKSRRPAQALPVLPFDKAAFLADSPNTKFIWYGHAALLLYMNAKTILIDPMLGPSAAPFFNANKRFSDDTLSFIDDFPSIDLLLLSHDHYDHLDYDSIMKLKHKTKRYCVALGLKRHLVQWGVAADKIIEFDWWQKQQFDELQIHFTPTRHFSGRGLTDRSKALWGGWVLQNDKEKIWFSGDGGYGQHLQTIGEKLGPFDFAFMECGQYNKMWPLVHFFPEQSVQAALQTNVKTAMPIHWAAFALSDHNWTEPAELFSQYAQEQQLNYVIPQLGEIVSINESYEQKWWWNKIVPF